MLRIRSVEMGKLVMGKRYWMAVLLSLCAASAFARDNEVVRKQVESSLLVNGTIDITADGTVAGYTLKNGEALPAGIKNMVARVVPQWRFAPIQLGEGATTTRAMMSLRFVAKELEDKTFSIDINAAQFVDDMPGRHASSPSMLPPSYPRKAASAGVGGTVYSVLKVGLDGRVEAAIVEQVNLQLLADELAMQRWREVLAEATLQAAKKWTFERPGGIDLAGRPYWLVRVPVDFVAPGLKKSEDYQWHAYVPGPRAEIPWSHDEPDTGGDAFAAGGAYPLEGGPRLLTSLNPS